MTSPSGLSPFEFESYKDFLKAWIRAQPHQGHGSKAAMARAAKCQTAYISQVVLGGAHLSLEQAERIGVFFALSEEELQYFLLLLQKDRSGTESLKRLFSKQMKAIRDRRAQLKNRLNLETKLSHEAQAVYFSSWIYPAVHLLAKDQSHSSRDLLAKRLSLPLSVIDDCLSFLESIGLLVREGGTLRAGSTRMHLPHDSPLISKHHINWRLKAIQDLESRNEDGLHYSSVVTLSKKDARILRESFLKTIESAKALIKDSEEECLYSFCLDFFEV